MNILIVCVDLHKPFRSTQELTKDESLEQAFKVHVGECAEEMLADGIVCVDEENMSVETEMYTYLIFNMDYKKE